MRIISGTHKGRQIITPSNLPIRPTTDYAKESLFNVLTNLVNFDSLSVCDLFCGSGSISYEFSSRGSLRVVAVDSNFKCFSFVRKETERLKLSNIFSLRQDVFTYLENCSEKFELIFADPPYDLPDISKIHRLVFEKKLLKPSGMLILEHPKNIDLKELTGFFDYRQYGNVNFTFFKFEQ